MLLWNSDCAVRLNFDLLNNFTKGFLGSRVQRLLLRMNQLAEILRDNSLVNRLASGRRTNSIARSRSPLHPIVYIFFMNHVAAASQGAGKNATQTGRSHGGGNSWRKCGERQKREWCQAGCLTNWMCFVHCRLLRWPMRGNETDSQGIAPNFGIDWKESWKKSWDFPNIWLLCIFY